MKDTYKHPTQSGSLGKAAVIGTATTLVLFLAVPIANSLSFSKDDSRRLRQVDTALQPPPPPPVEPPPPPEQTKEEEKPELDQKPPPLTLAQLEVALNPGTGSSGADFGLGGIISQFDALDEMRIFELSELDKHPNPIQRIGPQYPYEMKRSGISGWVRLVFVVDEKGAVRDIKVESSSHREFEQPAMDALRIWRFEPGYKDGRAVRVRMRQPLNFNLSD